jgi:hypothetical protein
MRKAFLSHFLEDRFYNNQDTQTNVGNNSVNT